MSFLNKFSNTKASSNDEPRKKRAFFRYFELLYRKFKTLVLLNLMYTACIFPLVCGFIYLVCSFFNIPAQAVEDIFFLRAGLWVINALTPPIFVVLLTISAIVYGPLTAGLTYASRNLADEKHVWVTDLFTRCKSNFKQGLALGILDIVALLCFLMYLASDFSALEGASIIFYKSIKIVAITAFVIYFCMRFYTYTMCVTFELKLKDILKNSLIFCVLGFFKNLVALLIIFVITLSFTSTPRIDVVLIATLFFSLCRFSVSFSTYGIIKKYMLEQIEKS